MKWYFKTSVLVIAFLSVGPIALPLLWFNPHYKRRTKIILTGFILVLSYVLGKVLYESLKAISQYYQQAFSGL